MDEDRAMDSRILRPFELGQPQAEIAGAAQAEADSIRQRAWASRRRAVDAQRNGEIAGRVLAFTDAHPDIVQFLDDLRALGILR